MRKHLRSLVALALATFMVIITPSLGWSQVDSGLFSSPSPSPSPEATESPVMLGAETLFVVRENYGTATPTQRASRFSEKIKAVAQDKTIAPASLMLRDQDGISLIMVKDITLVEVTNADAEALKTNRYALAKDYLDILAASIQQYRFERTTSYLARASAYALMATIILIIVLVIVGMTFPRLCRQLEAWRGNRIQGIRLRSFELMSADSLTEGLIGITQLIRNLLVVTILLTYFTLVLRFFPWTKYFGATLFEQVKAALSAMGEAVVAYLPKLFVIVLIITITYYLIGILRTFFHELGKGSITIPGFYPEWAEPTYRLLEILLIAMALVISFPYLPGSGSPAFRSISIFLGVLFSLGSTAAVSNAVSGIILIYTRAFQIGDRVKIADTEGDVEEKLLLVTRIRTPYNVLVTVPNASLLSNNIINYNASVRDTNTPLILHTTITLGYDNSWWLVHQTLIDAACATSHILEDPAPFVLQTALTDFYVHYELRAYTNHPNSMDLIYSELHKNIQEKCAEVGIEILSPHYSAVRDGNMSTIPANYLPDDYQAPGFQLNPLGSLFQIDMRWSGQKKSNGQAPRNS